MTAAKGKRQPFQKEKAPGRKNKPASIASFNPLENWVTIVLILIGMTAVVYGASINNGWTNWDDEGYVLENPLVKSIDLKAVFSSYVMGNYHPITVLAQGVEYQFFKEDAPAYHLMSLILHLINSLLLFYFVFKLGRKTIAAFVCALLFAIHPMHVESVSWISAQKDLIYTFFYFLSLILYQRYYESDKNKVLLYSATMLMFIFSLLSKAQAVTFPVLMLLIDCYNRRKLSTILIIEKLPFFILALAAGVVAVFAQKASESIQLITLYSWPERLMFACFAIVNYLLRFFIPFNLSAYYPYPEMSGHSFPMLVYAAPFILAVTGYLIYRLRKKMPYLPFGSLFFLINIFLVLQLLPVGGAITADRYSYLSYTGLFIAISFGFNSILETKSGSFRKTRVPLMVAFSVWIIFLSAETKARSQTWYSSETLWTDVISKYPRVPIAYNDLGSFYQKQQRLDVAKKNFDIALRLQPDFPQALINRCDLFRVENKIDSAIIDGNHAVKLKPGDPDTHMNRAIAYSMAEKNDSALADFRIVIRLQPRNARAYNNLGNLYMIKDLPDSAVIFYNLALKFDPEFLEVLNNRGMAFLKLGNFQEAVDDLTRAIYVSPVNANNYFFRMQAFEKLGNHDKAMDDAVMAMKLGVKIPEDYLENLRNRSSAH